MGEDLVKQDSRLQDVDVPPRLEPEFHREELIGIVAFGGPVRVAVKDLYDKIAVGLWSLQGRERDSRLLFAELT
jgi:hypothetical protein